MYEEKSKTNKSQKSNQKYNSELCDNKMTFEECELAILRHAVDESEQIQKQKVANSDEVKSMFELLETFIIRKKLILYGGLALNRLMPKQDQFYNSDIDLPDYDMFTENALDDAKELADLYHEKGYKEVEARSGVHHGTYKVFVNFIAIADITQLNPTIYRNIKKECITIAGMRYAPPNFLRMSMYLELSRPAGDTSRWEKVLKRLTLLNKYYPIKTDTSCDAVDFQRNVDTVSKSESENLYFLVRNNFIEQEVVFFGGYASSLYSKNMPPNQRRLISRIPDFDVLSTDPDKCALILLETLKDNGFPKCNMVEHAEIGEIIPPHIEILVGKETVAFIYKPIACHNYNTIDIGGKQIRIATIDTMLSFYLAFIYTNQTYFPRDRILCMAKFLFEVEEKNRLQQKGVLKRFSIECYGKQPTMEDLRAEKTQMFRKLVTKRGTREYEEWFLKYNPALNDNGKKNEKKNEKNAAKKSKEFHVGEEEQKEEIEFPPDTKKPVTLKFDSEKSNQKNLNNSVKKQKIQKNKKNQKKNKKTRKRESNGILSSLFF
jgi:hypothetical protein